MVGLIIKTCIRAANIYWVSITSKAMIKRKLKKIIMIIYFKKMPSI